MDQWYRLYKIVFCFTVHQPTLFLPELQTKMLDISVRKKSQQFIVTYVPKRRHNLCHCKPAQLNVAHRTGVRLHICMETFSWKYVSDSSDDLAEGQFGIEQRAMQNITDTQQTTAKAGTQYRRFTQHKKIQFFVKWCFSLATCMQ